MSGRLAQRLLRLVVPRRALGIRPNARAQSRPPLVLIPLHQAATSFRKRSLSTARASASVAPAADVTALVSTANLGLLDRDDDDGAVPYDSTGSDVRSADELEELVARVSDDAEAVVREALRTQRQRNPNHPTSTQHEVSVVICDNEYIRALNKQWLGIDEPTDVLSFEMADDVDEADPIVVMGDVVISLEYAASQAAERHGLYGPDYSTHDELRVLLVHGVLHLLGLDHELGDEASDVMAAEEVRIMQALSWKGAGLIELAGVESDSEEDEAESLRVDERSASSSGASSRGAVSSDLSDIPRDIRLVCIDMDGTLLDSASRISAATTAAVKRCLRVDELTVVLCTGKARPAAISACSDVGLAGRGGLVHSNGPGLFLQGLASYGPDGAMLPGPSLGSDVVRDCFEFSQRAGVGCVAFLGDDCVTTRMDAHLEELHTRYFEPLAQERALGDIVAGAPVRKLLFMSDVATIEARTLPALDSMLEGTDASTTQAVETMAEVVPKGWSKWSGLQQYIEAAGVKKEQVLAIGDGMNDLTMVQHAGYGVAMGNAQRAVKAAARAVVASNDDDGVAQVLDALLRAKS